jgi:transposase
MGRPYSQDLRERVVAAFRSGLVRAEVAARFRISRSSVQRWVRLDRQTGSVAAKPMGGKRPLALAEHRDWILARIARQPDLPLRALLAELHRRGIGARYYALWNLVRQAGLSFKKSLCASEQDRPEVARRREQWKARQGRIDPRRLVFVDETWTKTNMTPLRGRARVGKRLVGKAPHGHRKTLTFVAALRRDGIHAPWVLDKPINARGFRAWVQTCLVLILHPGDIVVMDNLSSHKAAVIRKAIRAVGAKLFCLPPYSPDLNPIEQVFAKLKTLLRKLNARTVDAVIQAIGQILDGFTAEECAHCFAHAGYRST